MTGPRTHYLDHAATTPMRAVAREAWLAAHEQVGNPSSLHHAGRRARSVVEDAREQLASLLRAHPTEVVFTSGATEANNLAIKGLFWSRCAHNPERTRIITSAVEHHAALDPARWLVTAQDAGLVELPVGPDAMVSIDALEAALGHEEGRADADSAQIALVSMQWVNNEIGTIQPVAQAVEWAHGAGVPVHSDAAQAAAYLPLDFAASGLATMAVSAHKVGGPVGVGALLVRRDVTLTPVAHGGGQQRARSGTLDAAGAAAFAAALTEAVAHREAEVTRLSELRDRLVTGLLAAVPNARVSGPDSLGASPVSTGSGPDAVSKTAPHITHIWFPGASAEAMLFGLDQRGIEVSTGSACTAGVVDASHVMLAMGHSNAEAAQALRVSLGHTSTLADVDALLAALPEVVARARG